MRRPTRQPAVAGQFYPADPASLRHSVTGYLAESTREPVTRSIALVAPHAGYMYSGPIAGSAYRGLVDQGDSFQRVVIIGPSHTLAFRGVAAPSVAAFDSPLGTVPVDQPALEALARQGLVSTLNDAHIQEHGIEVQLPFLQLALGEFELVPLVTGTVDPQVVADILHHQIETPNTLIVISSDLSHYHDYRTAQRLDQFTASAIEEREPDRIEEEHACGRTAIQGLLLVARDRNWSLDTLDLRNSGDTAGSKQEVVGYGAFLCHA